MESIEAEYRLNEVVFQKVPKGNGGAEEKVNLDADGRRLERREGEVA